MADALPLILTPVVCKLLATLIRDHMVEFLVKQWIDGGSPVDVVDFDKVLKFADDTKVFRKVKNDACALSLQDDLVYNLSPSPARN